VKDFVWGEKECPCLGEGYSPGAIRVVGEKKDEQGEGGVLMETGVKEGRVIEGEKRGWDSRLAGLWE